MQALPIDKIQSEFTAALKDHHLVVQAETGSGKSTRLPLWAATSGKVLVVEPRRVACTALAEYLAQLDNTPLGEHIGYAIRFDAQYNTETQVIFATPGVALRWLSESGLNNFNTVIIDEFHERRWDTDLLLALLKKKDKHRLVLTSATFDSQLLCEYLGGKKLVSEGRCFPVGVEHLAKNVQEMPTLDSLESRVRSATEQALKAHSGDILIFLPGRKEIKQCQQALQYLNPQQHLKPQQGTEQSADKVNIIPLHAAESKQTQRQALQPSKQRKIVLATNIAETSLTIPGVTVVIDSGLERRTHQRNGRTVLGLHAISKASAEQRKGRAGRTQAGLCLRLYGEFAQLEPATPPAILREELVEPMLAAACCGTPLAQLTLPNPLPENALKRAHDKLIKMQAVNMEGNITEHGKILYPLPLDTLFAHLITAMPNPVLRCAMVDTVSALSQSQSLFKLPDTEAAHKALKEWQAQACDISTLISLMRSDAIPAELNYDATQLNEARTMSNRIRKSMALPTLKKSPAYSLSDLQDAIVKAVPELIFIRRSKRRQDFLGNGYSEVTVGRDTRFAEDAEAAIVLDQYLLPGKGTKQNLALATCMSPVRLKQMCRWQLGEVNLGRSLLKKRAILVQTQRVYAGREIETSECAPNKAQLPEAVTALIIQKRLFPKVIEQLEADLHAWKIYLTLENRQDPVPEPYPYLSDKLRELGVESQEDLALIDDSDLAFDGVPDWQREEIDANYPHLLTLASLRLKVTYELKRKTVFIEKLAGTRKTDPKRWELPKWPGLKVRYRVASRVVDVR
ncbi:MAG: DEAD/DEAH box helicase [Alteromonadaceae bacterium]|nr:MAG: DEAD/DEAH box helicase [Alteromonadaceae bacterium]